MSSAVHEEDYDGSSRRLSNMDSVNSTEVKKSAVVSKLPEPPTNISKKQLKRMKKKEKWLEWKIEKRLQEKAKAREKRAYARANNLSLGPSRKLLKQSTMAASSCRLTVTIDLSLDELMIDKDIAKLTKQILRCYTLNRRTAAPIQFSLTSFTGKSRADMEKHNGYEHWDVSFHSEPYINVYPKDKIIYLTSESENTIEHLDHNCVYVIGGLVDHNSHKGICHRLAIEANVRHGRLPLDKFLQMKARKVLTIDHVFEILLRVTEGNSWQEAFLKVLPERKNARPILPEQSEENGSSDLKPVDVNNTSVEVDNICNKESNSRLSCNIESKKILEDNPCRT